MSFEPTAHPFTLLSLALAAVLTAGCQSTVRASGNADTETITQRSSMSTMGAPGTTRGPDGSEIFNFGPAQ